MTTMQSYARYRTALIRICVLASFFSIGLGGSEAIASCCLVPCWDCTLEQEAQVTIVSMRRDRGEIEMIPNISFHGQAERFALVVPTPTEPRFAPVDREIWDELWRLTAPTSSRAGLSEGLGCSTVISEPVRANDPEDVEILSHVQVGAFLATVVRSDDTRALIEWLNERGYGFTEADQAHVAPLVEAGWVFTAMELDTTVVDVPQSWNHSVDPVSITFEADRFDVPLGFISINRDRLLQMVFLVIDDHRAALSGFEVVYANSVSNQEARAIGDTYPTLARLVSGGRFLTRLDADFHREQSMTGLRPIARASNDDEFRRTWSFGSVVPLEASEESSRAARLATAVSNSIPGQLFLALLLLAPLTRRQFFARKVR